MAMRPIDPDKLRRMEHNAREIGAALKSAMDRMPGGRKEFGFALLIMSFDGPELTYISSIERKGMMDALQELLTKLRSEEPGTSESRN